MNSPMESAKLNCRKQKFCPLITGISDDGEGTLDIKILLISEAESLNSFRDGDFSLSLVDGVIHIILCK